MKPERQFWIDIAIGSVITCAGLGAFTIIIHWLLPTPGAAPTRAAFVIDQRWPQPLPKADRLAAADPIDAGLLQPPLGEEKAAPPPGAPGGPIEQAIERKTFESDVERLERKYRRSARKLVAENDDDDRPRDVCARHGMHKRYLHRHRHLSWRCARGR
jgi:hypothetical protein